MKDIAREILKVAEELSGPRDRKAADWAVKMVKDLEEQVENLEMEVSMPLNMEDERVWRRADAYLDSVRVNLGALKRLLKKVDI